MVRLPVIAAAMILPGLALAQPADDAAKCLAASGSYLTGTVVSGPRRVAFRQTCEGPTERQMNRLCGDTETFKKQ
jgi:hypothetical protein